MVQIKQFWILWLAACCLLCGCKGCEEEFIRFLDRNTLVIPKGDKTAPEVWLEITESKSGSNYKIYHDTILTKSNGDQLSVVFMAKDENGGLKKLCLSQGFRQECCSTHLENRLCSVTQPVSVSNCTDMSSFAPVAFASWFMLSEINVSMICDSNWELESGSVNLTAVAENFHQGTKAINLVVQVTQ